MTPWMFALGVFIGFVVGFIVGAIREEAWWLNSMK